MEDKKDIIYTCTNPQVLDRTLMCDGNCWNCGYHQPKQDHIGELKVIDNTDSYLEGIKEGANIAYEYFSQWKDEPDMAEKLAKYKGILDNGILLWKPNKK